MVERACPNAARVRLESLTYMAALTVLSVLAIAGCGRRSVEGPQLAASPPAEVPASPENDKLNNDSHEFWELHQIGGVRVGHARTAITRTHDGASMPVVRVEGQSAMSFQRAGQHVAMNVEFTSKETPDGRLLEYACKISQGSMLIQETAGRVVGAGDTLELTTTTAGKAVTTSIPWSVDYGGLIAGEQSLWQKPMQPGESRTIEAIVPGFNQVGRSEMAAKDYEQVAIFGKTYELLRIDLKTTFEDGQSHRSTLWTDRRGDILRKLDGAMNMESIRVPKEVALAKSNQTPFDLVLGMSVDVDRRLTDPHATRRIRYLVRLGEDDPAAAFPAGNSQEVKSLGPSQAEVTVYAVRPGQPGNPNPPSDPPTDEDRQPTSLIQSDNPKIVEMAARAAPEEKDPWALAVALEQFVRNYITATDYSQAFATAAQVAESRTGDCTEHAVLLAALARARGIPARVVVGLVYTEQTGRPGFGFHMWNELYAADRWIPLDATLGRGGIGAAHLKLTHSNLAAASAFSSFLPVAQVAGKLKIQIEEVEQ